MNYSVIFFFNSILFGVGLAMDAFSVSMANGLNEPQMKPGRMLAIAGTFAAFQIVMPLIGWFCVHTISNVFLSIHKFIPWIALLLLLFIGGKMLFEGIHDAKSPSIDIRPAIGFWALIIQGIATSIDALSVGFTIADYDFPMALIESIIIGVMTLLICLGGLVIGKKLGTRLASKSSILGGIILIAIGIEIFISGII